MKAFVYKCLAGRKEHRGLWSVRAMSGPCKGLVVAHARHLVLTDVSAHISEAGRQRTIEEKRKRVHAGLVGNVATMNGDFDSATYAAWYGDEVGEFTPVEHLARRISYNPYYAGHFFVCETKEPVHSMESVFLNHERGVFIN